MNWKGYTGKTCETKISYCRPDSCSRNGLCVEYTGGYYCKCSSGFIGEKCSVKEDICLNHECVNGACLPLYSTIANLTSSWTCLCDRGYTGRKCDIPIDLCALNNGNCINNSTCRQLSPGFAYCDCQTGFTGSFCEIAINPCNLVNCLNGGICVSNPASSNFTCNCLQGKWFLSLPLNFG
jgi:Notch 1